MHFDVPKVVRSPGCDHGHDKESRNGRDIKIDILEAYVWTSEVFRVKSGFFRSTGSLPEHPSDLMGLSGPWWKERRDDQGMGRAPSPIVRIGQGEGCIAPLPSSPPPLSPSLLVQQGKGGSPTPGRSRTPPAPPPPGRRTLPPWLLYILRQGHL